MAYYTDKQEICCRRCEAINHVVVHYFGIEQANEKDTGHCVECGAGIVEEKCGVIVVACTADEAAQKLKAALTVNL